MPNSPSTSDSPSRPRSYQHTSTHPPATQQPPEPTSISANSPMSAPPGSNPTAPPFFPDALPSEIASGVIDSARESSSQDSNRGQVQTRVRAHNSARVTDFINPQTKVVSTVVTGPKDHITDPTLFQQGGAAQAMYPETPEDEEKLFSTFKRRSRSREFFVFGKVFYILWAEPASDSTGSDISMETSTTNNSEFTKGLFGEKVFSKVRRFIVVREGKDYCTALPITTYGGQGVAKRGVIKSEHGVIYSGKVPPEINDDERPGRGGEEPMCRTPIRIDPDEKGQKLDRMSRIDYGKTFTIHHNLKVRSFGKVNRDSEEALKGQFREVFERGLK